MKIMSAKEVATLIYEQGTITVDFTFDDDLYNPSGWYGIKTCSEFDGYSLLFGDYGYGIIDVAHLNNWSIEEITQTVQHFWDMGMDVHIEKVCVDDGNSVNGL